MSTATTSTHLNLKNLIAFNTPVLRKVSMDGIVGPTTKKCFFNGSSIPLNYHKDVQQIPILMDDSDSLFVLSPVTSLITQRNTNSRNNKALIIYENPIEVIERTINKATTSTDEVVCNSDNEVSMECEPINNEML
ncbi:hypothetical protein QTN25_006021 [Entamoeba marina]